MEMMTMTMQRLCCVSITLVLLAATAAGADWPGFQGPERTGVVEDGLALARSWPEAGPPVRWRVQVGEGFGGAAIVGDSVLILDREQSQRDVLRRLRLADGKEVWRYAYEAPGKVDYNGSRSTPSCDGTNVYTIGPFGHIRAVRLEDGKEVWAAHLLDDWEAKRPQWGVSQSPLVLGDLLIVAPWGSRAAVVAYDRMTGKVVWKVPNPDGKVQDYQSPVPMVLGQRQTVVASGKAGYTIGVDVATGKRLWTFDGFDCRWHIPSPTVVGKHHILLTGGYKAGAVLFEVRKRGSRYSAHTVWDGDAMGSKLPQPLVYQGYIYGNSSDNRGGLRCITPEGKVIWQTKRDPGFGMGNLLLVNGIIYIVNGKNGVLVMAEATPKEYRELGRAQILSGKEVWGPLAYAGGKLVLRDQQQLVCVDLTGDRTF
jgi:outer membrane protein assembly factor BamB